MLSYVAAIDTVVVKERMPDGTTKVCLISSSHPLVGIFFFPDGSRCPCCSAWLRSLPKPYTLNFRVVPC